MTRSIAFGSLVAALLASCEPAQRAESIDPTDGSTSVSRGMTTCEGECDAGEVAAFDATCSQDGCAPQAAQMISPRDADSGSHASEIRGAGPLGSAMEAGFVVTQLDAGFVADAGAASEAAAPDAAHSEAGNVGAGVCDAGAGTCAPCDASDCNASRALLMCADGVLGAQSSCALGSAVELAYGSVLAQPLVPAVTVRLLKLGAHTAPGSGCNAYLSLHADANGEPGAILNATSYRPLEADAGNLTPAISASERAVRLTAGTRYWLVARLGGSQSCRLFFSSSSDAASSYRIGTASSVSAPDDMSTGQTNAGPGGTSSLFIQAERWPG